MQGPLNVKYKNKKTMQTVAVNYSMFTITFVYWISIMDFRAKALQELIFIDSIDISKLKQVSIKRLKLFLSCTVALVPIHGGRDGSGGYIGIAGSNGCTQACSPYLSCPLPVDALRRTQLPEPFMWCG